jgi:hypothetical protein
LLYAGLEPGVGGRDAARAQEGNVEGSLHAGNSVITRTKAPKIPGAAY